MTGLWYFLAGVAFVPASILLTAVVLDAVRALSRTRFILTANWDYSRVIGRRFWWHQWVWGAVLIWWDTVRNGDGTAELYVGGPGTRGTYKRGRWGKAVRCE